MNIFNIGSKSHALLLKQIVAIDLECLPKDHWTFEQWNESFTTPHYDLFYQISEVDLQSFALFSYVSGNQYVDLLKIGTRFIDQRKGLAQRLLAQAFKEYSRQKVESVILEVRLHNEQAIHFYSKLGFRNDMLLKSYYSDGADGLRMWCSV